MKNDLIWWTIEKPYGGKLYSLSPYYSSSTRKHAIEMITYNTRKEWVDLKKQGFKAVKVTVKKVKK